MILVTGASGNVGGDLIPQLLERGERVRALVRDERKVAHLPPAVERVTGDLGKPETLAAAMKGARALFLMTSEGGSTTHVENAVAAAKAASIGHVVYLSSLAAVRPTTMIGRWHRSREQLIEASGLPWTFLRPGGFMSNCLRWAGTIKAQGVVYAPDPRRKSHPIDSLDMAAVAAVALTSPGHRGKTYPMTGEEKLSTADEVAVLGRVLDKPLRCIDVSAEDARAGMLRSGMSPLLAEAVMELVASDWDEHEPKSLRTVRGITGRPPSTFEDWARRHRQAFQ